MTRVAVKAGDCLSSIAQEHGHFWETLWNHADNAALRGERQDPNVLMAGDVVVVPPITVKQESRASDARHRFRQRGVPAKCRFRLLKDGQPRGGVPYILSIDGQTTSGTTDSDGLLEAPIPPSAREGSIRVREGQHEEVYPLTFGGLDPIDTPGGTAQRLAQLGYRVTDDPGAPIRAFQHAEGLDPSGMADEETLRRLQEVYGQ